MIHHVRQLFDRVGNDEEVVKWIREFSSYGGIFAALKTSGASIQHYLGPVCEDLAILSRLDLITPVVYGWGDAFTERLNENGIKTERHGKTGLRITKKEDLPHLEDIAEENGTKLLEGLNSRDVDSKIVTDVFRAERRMLDGVPDTHYTGVITGIDTEKIRKSLMEGVIPLIPSLGYSADGTVFNINADEAAKALVRSLNPRRYIAITNTGGVLDSKKKIIPEISLKRDYDRLIGEGVITGQMKLKVDEAKELIEKGNVSTVQVAHPNNVLIELFTDKGKGTYIRK